MSRRITCRRGRLARFVVLLAALCLTGAGYAALAPAAARTGSVEQSTLSQGRKLFLVGCASCHGEQGEGIVTKSGNQYGPALVGVGAAAVDFQVGTGRMPLARTGGQPERKEVVYSPAEIAALAGYVASLGPGPAIPRPSAYDAAGSNTASIVRGGEFFLTNCTACHNYAGSGGALPDGRWAPQLSKATSKEMYEAMLTGPAQMPVFSDQVLRPSEKRDIIAYVRSIQAAPHYGGASLGSLGPVTEGVAAWLVGVAGAVGLAVWIASRSTRSTRGRSG